MLKKIILYLTGPGAIIYLGVVFFIHLFTDKSMLLWMIPALIVFFLVFLPVYAIENFKHNDRKSRENNPDIQFGKNNSHIKSEGGNIHGHVSEKTEGADFMKKGK
jgi:heme/copper-type cytochrome/quinol oxidase subunit 2